MIKEDKDVDENMEEHSHHTWLDWPTKKSPSHATEFTFFSGVCDSFNKVDQMSSRKLERVKSNRIDSLTGSWLS